ncbi:MAG TPA: DUF3857 domain-containing protein [bacterium]
MQKNLSALKKYPKASSIVLWTEDSYVLRSDGSKTVESHVFRYLPDEASRDNFGDPRINYLAGRDSLMILTARTYTKDGRTIDCTPHNAYNPVVPDGLDKAPDYAPYRQMVVTLMGLENGCITELHYCLNTPKPQFPWLEGRVYLREENPVIARRLVVQIPDGQTLNYKVDRGAPEPAVSGATYTWTVGEQSGYDKQDLQGHRVLLPNVAFTSARNWEQIQTELKLRLDAASAGDLVIPESLGKTLVGVSGDENRLDAIKTWVKGRFNRYEFDHPDFGLTLRPVKDVLASGYGNGLELAAMVSKIANQFGLSTQVVPCFVPDAPVPCVHEISGAVVAMRAPGGAYGYSDPVIPGSEFGSADLLGYWLVPLDNTKEPPFEFASKVKNPFITLSLSFDGLNQDTLKGTGTLSAQGEFGMYETVRESGPEAILKRNVRVKGFTITKAAIKDLESPRHGSTVAIDFSFTAVHAMDTLDRYHVLPLSIAPFEHVVADAPLSLTTREFRQEVRSPITATLHVECAIPDAWQVKDMPKNLTRKWDFDEGTVKSEVKDGRFVFERTLKLSKEWIPPESWSSFRAFMLDAGKRPDNTVVFEPKDAKTAKK